MLPGDRACLPIISVVLLLASPGLVLAQDEPPPADEPQDEDEPGEAEDEAEAEGEAEGEAEEPTPRAKKKKKGKGKNAGRDLDPESPEAEALTELLRMEANYAKDGSVLLTYTFRDEEHIADWDQSGFDQAEGVSNKRGRKRARRNRGAKPRFLALGVSSRGKGLLLHRLELEEEFEIEFICNVERTSTRSDLVFMVGKAGARWGNQLAKRSGKGFKPLDKKSPLSRDAFAGGKRVKVKLTLKDKVLTSWVNGERMGSSKRLKPDGRVGIYATDMLLIVHSIEIKGKINKAKL